MVCKTVKGTCIVGVFGGVGGVPVSVVYDQDVVSYLTEMMKTAVFIHILTNLNLIVKTH